MMVDNQEVEKNILSSVVDKALISCQFPFNWTQLSAAVSEGGQPRGGEEYPEPGGGQHNRLWSHVTFPLTIINRQLLEVMVDNQEVEKNILSLVVDSLIGFDLMSLSL